MRTMKIKFNKETVELLRGIKRIMVGAFVEEAVLHYSRTEEGKDKLKRWGREIRYQHTKNDKGLIEGWD